MFELSIALKYLLPKKRSLSAALISIMSVAVISLVVWLVLVFLSITAGIERNWLQKLTAMHAPIRISPTEAYYDSYFYQVDTLASSSNYTYKTIGEKNEAFATDPYQDEMDAEIPSYFSIPDLKENRTLKDPVKETFSLLQELQKQIPSLAFQDYEIGGALMRLSLKGGASLSQMSYLLSMPDQNPKLRSLILPIEEGPIDFDKMPQTPPRYAHFVKGKLQLPDLQERSPAIIPKSYKESGVQIGDLGTFSFANISALSMQEQKVPFQVVGFYDPGIMSSGNKCILVPSQITRDIYASTQTFSPDGTPTNGIFVWTDTLGKTKEIEEKITQALHAKGISSYWKVTDYEHFEFSKDLLHQFRSDKTLLLIIAAIILIVACCNIISLLVLLVHDKQKEIAVLQSMGASFRSIAAIFAGCGVMMGAISSILGSLLALFTLHHIDAIVSFLSLIQGRAAFNPAFFGETLPSTLSLDALLFVLIATPLISGLAGLVPAMKAAKLRPSEILRTQ